jgi:hypothetical protein
MKALFSLVMIAAFLAVSVVPPSISGGERPAGEDGKSQGRRLPESVAQLWLSSPRMVAGVSAADIGFPVSGAKGVQQVVVRLRTDPVVDEADDSPKARRERRSAIETEQRDFLERLREIAPQAKVLGRLRLVLNAVLAEVETSVLAELASDPAVLGVTPVLDYKLTLSETVP